MQYPDLTRSKIVCVDIETYDPDLKEMGTAVYREKGLILGVALADETGFAEYYNLGHYDCPREEHRKNIAYLEEMLSANNNKLGTNLSYDIDWLENWLDIKVNGQLLDIQIAEALIDENQGHYSLDFLSLKYLGMEKFKTEIDQFCTDNNLKGDSRGWLWKMPYKLVRQYAIVDVLNPLAIFKKQWKVLCDEDLLEVLHLECDLIRCLLHFRKTGVKIDVDRRDRNALKVQNIIEAGQIELFKEFGKFNTNSSPQVAKILDGLNITYPYTKKGNPQINMAFYKLNREKYPVLKKIQYVKQAKHELTIYLDGAFVRFLTTDGLIHCNLYNTKTDEYGTRSGRLSSALPNLQQISSKDKFRDPLWGQLCREIFIPFQDCIWLKTDYSQIEYRFISHYAVGPGSEELRAAYRKDPKTDYHKYIMELTGLPRGQAKALNFGIPYGMGILQMCIQFGWEEENAREIKKTYMEKAPYLRPTIDAVTRVAEKRGYIKTILNRRSRLIDKSKSYIMFCRLIQGGAADLMKKSMLNCYNAGVFDVLHPHMTLHDELDSSLPRTKQGLEAAKEMVNIMETCLEISVPIKVDFATGPNWADIKDTSWTKLKKELGL